MNILAVALRFLLTGLVFLISFKFGQDVAKSKPIICAKPGLVEVPAIPVAWQKTEEHSYPNLLYSPYKYHKNHGKPINEIVFSQLYHTNSQTKAEFIITSLAEWQDAKTKKVSCTEIYRTNTGSRSNQPAKCVAIVSVSAGFNSPAPLLLRKGVSAGRVDQFMNDYTRHENRREGETMLPSFLRNIDNLKDSFLSIVGSPEESPSSHNGTSFTGRKTLVVMVANSGVFDLLLNFMCSCRSSGIDTKSVVVFVGEARHVGVVSSMGATAVFLPAMGEMPARVAGNYGDKVFGKMMWLKVTSVYIANCAGFNVLFQDTDLVWFKNPIPFFDLHPVDSSFMDDGARSPRFAPYFSNSGFYYLKYNDRTRYLMHRMMLSVFEISYTHSHQGTLTKYMMEASNMAKLQISALSQMDFPSGKMFHHNKTYMKQLHKGLVDPYVFHMCWTANSKDKIKNFLSINKWYVGSESRCAQPGSTTVPKDLLNACCVEPSSATTGT